MFNLLQGLIQPGGQGTGLNMFGQDSGLLGQFGNQLGGYALDNSGLTGGNNSIPPKDRSLSDYMKNAYPKNSQQSGGLGNMLGSALAAMIVGI